MKITKTKQNKQHTMTKQEAPGHAEKWSATTRKHCFWRPLGNQNDSRMGTQCYFWATRAWKKTKEILCHEKVDFRNRKTQIWRSFLEHFGTKREPKGNQDLLVGSERKHHSNRNNCIQKKAKKLRPETCRALHKSRKQAQTL